MQNVCVFVCMEACAHPDTPYAIVSAHARTRVRVCVLQLHLSSASSPSFIILQHKVLPQHYRNSCFFQTATENGLLPGTQRHLKRV